jgi:hypothetical protein
MSQINAAYAHHSDFGHINYQIYTKDTLTFEQIKAFLRKLERNYVNIQPNSRHVAPLPVMIKDKSRSARRGNLEGSLIGFMTFDPESLCAVRGIGMGSGDRRGKVFVRKADDEESSEGSDVGEDF